MPPYFSLECRCWMRRRRSFRRSTRGSTHNSLKFQGLDASYALGTGSERFCGSDCRSIDFRLKILDSKNLPGPGALTETLESRSESTIGKCRAASLCCSPILFPEIVEADLLFHQLFTGGNVLGDVPEQEIRQGAAVFFWTNQRRLAFDAYHLGCVGDYGLEVSDVVDQLHIQCLLAGPDFAVCDWLYGVVLQPAAIGDGLDELSEHVVDQALHVGLLGGSEIARGIAGIFELAGFDDDVFELGPFQQVTVVDPLGDDADRSDDAALVRINLVGSRGYVERAAGSDRFDRDNNFLLLLVANALYFAVDLLGCGDTSAGRVHVKDNRFDRRVLAEFLQLVHDRLRGKDDAFEVDDADAISEAAETRVLPAGRMQGEIDEGEDGQHEEEKCSSSDEDPEQGARTSFRHGESLALGGSGRIKRMRRYRVITLSAER